MKLKQVKKQLKWMIVLLLAHLSSPIDAVAQHRGSGSQKLSPVFAQKIRLANGKDSLQLRVLVAGSEAPSLLMRPHFQGRKISRYNGNSFFVVRATTRELDAILNMPQVLFVEDAARTARDEGLINNFDL